MKRILLATVAAAALSFPAFAAPNNNMNKQPNQKTQMQQNNMQQSGNKMGSANRQKQAQTQRVMPSQLSKQQIKQLQMSLNKKGMNSGHVDGIWGPITATAVRNFQKEQNINANGHLTRQTLAALGVKTQNRQNAQNQQPNKKGFVGAGPSETTGQGSNMGSSMGSHSSKSNAMSKPSTTGQGSNMGTNSNNSNTKQSNQKPNQIKANPSNQSGQMKKTKQ